jgi:class 3 adenylate cyclase
VGQQATQNDLQAAVKLRGADIYASMNDQRAQRRLAAILAADVVGYSRLVGVDEEGTLARLRVLRREVVDPMIKEHRGRIVRITGDGLLVQLLDLLSGRQSLCRRPSLTSRATRSRMDFA